MLKKLLCWLLGHKTVVKCYTREEELLEGNVGKRVTTDITIHRSDFCLRCGRTVETQTKETPEPNP
jgi:hypothetical protein